MVLRLSELYTSIQGEGPNVGLPTQFVRFAGCNLRCPGWPCDTPHAIDPAIWRHESQKLTPSELYEMLEEWPRAITLTGGEPFLQNNEALEEFCLVVKQNGYSIECFTNGTFLLPMTANIDYILDWKVKGSGERLTTQQHEARKANVLRMCIRDAVKFTVADEFDLLESHATYDLLRSQGAICQFFVGGVWGKIEDVVIVNYIEENKLDWRLNVQLHKHIWPAEARGV